MSNTWDNIFKVKKAAFVFCSAAFFTFSFTIALPAKAAMNIVDCSSEDAMCGSEALTFSHTPPKYVVRLVPSNNLPHALFDLTKRALRLLPEKIQGLQPMETYDGVPSEGYIRISTEDPEPFCDRQKHFCWFKSMTITSKWVFIENYEGVTETYVDNENLYQLFWNDSLSADKQLN